MRPVDQRRIYSVNPDGIRGDCFSACLASVLELDLEEVPVFADDAINWIADVNEWLAGRGYCLVAYDVSDGEVIVPDCVHVASGPHPDCPEEPGGHAVVMRGNEILHDPNPGRKGIREVVYRWVLVPLEDAPVRTIRRLVRSVVISTVALWAIAILCVADLILR